MTTTREARERLIDEVKRFPVLYDTQHEHHRDIDVRDRCWAEIAARLDANSELLKREWKILRDSLRQSLKKSRATTKAGMPCKKWRFQSRMTFLLPYMTKRNTRQRHNFGDDVKLDMDTEVSEAVEGEDGTPWPEVPPSGSSELDSLELFFASVCASARRLPTPQLRELKRRVLDALLRAEADAEADAEQPQPSSSDPHDHSKRDGPF